MKAILMTAVDVLQLQEVPTPKISQPHQVLVALKAAGVNPIDTKIRKRGTFYPEQMPAILGCDGAGIVEAVGAAVQDFRPGDEVYFCNGGLGKAGTGNYAEYALIETAPRSLRHGCPQRHLRDTTPTRTRPVLLRRCELRRPCPMGGAGHGPAL